ncbi:hypothetical protein BH24PSE2_BH24PSE2_15120 [soil metagenome]
MRRSLCLPDRVSICLWLVLLLAGCASAPVQEMSDARQAISAAEEAGADDSAPRTLEEARRLLTDAEAQLQGRRYFAARRNAVQAKAKALAALEATDDKQKAEDRKNRR